jgi:uncharacterized membrane protein
MGIARRAVRRGAVATVAVVGTAAVVGASSGKKQAAQAQQQAAPAPAQTSDPVQVLKDRLANGEITLEEYNQMLAAIAK